MRKSGIAVFLQVLIASAMSTGALAQVSDEDKDVLRGLTHLYVVVERIQPEIERDGLYASTLQEDAEMKLKMAGLRILASEEESKQPAEIPHLYLQVNARKFSGGYIFDTRVGLREPVVLLRKRARIDGTTLRIRGHFGCTSRLSDIREGAREAIDHFIEAWQEANPK